MNKVIVTVIGVQKDASGEENRIELVSVGKHCYKNGINYVLYEDSEISGMQGTSTLLKIAKNHVTLVRRGEVTQEQHFAEMACSSSVYTTPYGKMTLSVATNKLEIHYGSVSGAIAIDYALSVDGQWQSNNQLQIKICADGATCSNMN